MPEKVRVICTCSHGMGSCLILKWTAESVLKKHGYEADVIASDMATCKGDRGKIILTDKLHAGVLGEMPGKKVVTIRNFTSKDEMEVALIPAVKEMYPSAI